MTLSILSLPKLSNESLLLVSQSHQQRWTTTLHRSGNDLVWNSSQTSPSHHKTTSLKRRSTCLHVLSTPKPSAFLLCPQLPPPEITSCSKKLPLHRTTHTKSKSLQTFRTSHCHQNCSHKLPLSESLTPCMARRISNRGTKLHRSTCNNSNSLLVPGAHSHSVHNHLLPKSQPAWRWTPAPPRTQQNHYKPSAPAITITITLIDLPLSQTLPPCTTRRKIKYHVSH